ncbi:MAG: MBL fold metallo-hydrolase [Rhizobiales bacterium]|jgi:glyoxylase-like metal-dependent hydrolase (beta-lactamase superfamily II)|nr:MBL fold metallo-hydrolase [Hyphomicrobiales bacterium]
MEQKKPSMLADGVRWFDDWFAIEDIAPGVYAIGEPRFHQINWNYLIEGQDTVLLFDTGPGVRDISQVVRALTDFPLITLPSHLHFDHTGNLQRFQNIALADLPVLRSCMRDGLLHASDDLFRGFLEGMVWKPVKISQWLPIGSRIDLGGRQLEVLHTPGHSPDSISLFDREANILFAADFVYPGPLYAQVPGANLADYLTTSVALLTQIDDQTKIFCGHGAPDEKGKHRAPLMGSQDISDLQKSLASLKDSGKTPKETTVNARMTLLANKAAYASWQAG